MILVTGAAGKTGLAVLNALSRNGIAARALVHHGEQSAIAKRAGAADVVVGDLLDEPALLGALTGIEAVYLICPNVHPQELEIGRAVIAAAMASEKPRIVYHSVMYPQIEAMPHHWLKLRVEESLIASGLDFTILQPASYMQNLLPYWAEIFDRGEYKIPYSIDAVFSPIHVDDLAEVAALTLTDRSHAGGIYQLAGPGILSSREMAAVISAATDKNVRAIQQPLDHWLQTAQAGEMSHYAIDALTKMFAYYNAHGFAASSVQLELLLKRKANKFVEFVEGLTN